MRRGTPGPAGGPRPGAGSSCTRRHVRRRPGRRGPAGQCSPLSTLATAMRSPPTNPTTAPTAPSTTPATVPAGRLPVAYAIGAADDARRGYPAEDADQQQAVAQRQRGVVGRVGPGHLHQPPDQHALRRSPRAPRRAGVARPRLRLRPSPRPLASRRGRGRPAHRRSCGAALRHGHRHRPHGRAGARRTRVAGGWARPRDRPSAPSSSAGTSTGRSGGSPAAPSPAPTGPTASSSR